MPARRPREQSRPLDSQALALSIFASLSGAILSSALGAGELGSLLCAAIAPALTAIVTHPGPHRHRRLALVVALLALLHLIQSALARVRGRQARATTARAGGLRIAGLTACIAFAISAALLTTPELVLGDAFVTDRRLTLFPAGTPDPPPGPRPTPTPEPTTSATPEPTPTATPRKPKPRPPETAVPERDVPDPRALDPDGPPPDRTAPELDLPATVAARASDRREAVVHYAVRAVDGTDGAVTPACRPPSGSQFGVGMTTVRCTARDRAGNVARGSFVVRVAAPPRVTPRPTPNETPERQPDRPQVPEPPKDPESPKAPENPAPPESPQPPEIPPPPDEPDPDRTPPAFTGPRLITVDTDARDGVPVTYPPPQAVDDRDGPVRARCVPRTVPAGSRAAVQCTATDRAGNPAQATFMVWVRCCASTPREVR